MVSCIMLADCITMYLTNLFYLEKYYLVDSVIQTEMGILHLSKEAPTINQNSGIV